MDAPANDVRVRLQGLGLSIPEELHALGHVGRVEHGVAPDVLWRRWALGRVWVSGWVGRTRIRNPSVEKETSPSSFAMRRTLPPGPCRTTCTSKKAAKSVTPTTPPCRRMPGRKSRSKVTFCACLDLNAMRGCECGGLGWVGGWMRIDTLSHKAAPLPTCTYLEESAAAAAAAADATLFVSMVRLTSSPSCSVAY